MTTDSTRWHVLFHGRVQGVGFRFRTERIAERFPVTGYVKNLPDGRVELVAEGPAAEVAEFIQQVQEEMAGYIDGTIVEQGPARGAFDRFEIRV